MELNASDERGISTIRQKVKNFAKIQSPVSVPFKILLLDEADALTKQAQMALRRIMEQYYRTVRFILTVNALGRLISAIVSRCAVFHFRGLHPSNMLKLLKRVATAEGAWISDFTLQEIVRVSRGDARMALNILEAMLTIDKPTAEDVRELVGEITPDHAYHLVHRMLQGRMDALDLVQKLLDEDAQNPTAIINTIYFGALRGTIPGITDDQRLILLEAIGTIPGVTDEHRLISIIAKVIREVRA